MYLPFPARVSRMEEAPCGSFREPGSVKNLELTF